jgi:hypothetical protein
MTHGGVVVVAYPSGRSAVWDPRTSSLRQLGPSQSDTNDCRGTSSERQVLGVSARIAVLYICPEVVVYDIANGVKLANHSIADPNTVAWVGDSSVLYWLDGPRLKGLEPTANREIQWIELPETYEGLAFSARGDRIALSRHDKSGGYGPLFIGSFRGGHVGDLLPLRGTEGYAARKVGFHPTGDALAMVRDTKVQRWNVSASPRRSASFGLPNRVAGGTSSDLGYSQDGSIIVFADSDLVLSLDATTGAERCRVDDARLSRPIKIAGNLIAVVVRSRSDREVGAPGRVELWEIATCQMRGRLEPDSKP